MKRKSLLTRFVTWRGSDYVALSGAIALLCALVIPTIGNASIWFDEAFSSYLTKFNFIEIARYTATDVHPPLYYWILKLWEMIVGYDNAGWIRALSLVFAAVAAVFAFLLVRRMFGRKAAVLGLLFVVISPMIIRYSEEARMYMMEAAIILAATYTMVRALEQKRRKLWVIYGILVGLGMWTHYFTALVWLAHWAWRYLIVRKTGLRGKMLARQFFSKEWLLAYIVAVGVFVPWLPLMAYQLAIVQGGGFWVGPVGVDTPANYMTNTFFYLQHGQITGWLALLLVAVVVGSLVMGRRVYRSFDSKKRQSFLLLICIAVVPVALLILTSLPPLRSSFVERYLIPSTIATMLLLGVVFAYGLARYNIWKQIVVIATVVAMFGFGISNVYYYGNFNKNSNVHITTGELIQKIDAIAKPGEPIIAKDPWVFYEAVFYSTTEHPVYFVNADTQYIYGSLDMLKYSDQHKITDASSFFAQHPTVWYVGNTPDATVTSDRTKGWHPLQTISAHDSILNVDLYKGTEYTTD